MTAFITAGKSLCQSCPINGRLHFHFVVGGGLTDQQLHRMTTDSKTDTFPPRWSTTTVITVSTVIPLLTRYNVQAVSVRQTDPFQRSLHRSRRVSDSADEWRGGGGSRGESGRLIAVMCNYGTVFSRALGRPLHVALARFAAIENEMGRGRIFHSGMATTSTRPARG